MLSLLLLAQTASSVLAPLQRYAGHCWIADIADGITDRHCFTLLYGGAHLRDEHVVMRAGKPVYRGETIYSAEGGEISFTYWNALGGVGRGTARADGSELRFEMSMRATPEAAPQHSITVWRETASGYDATTGGVTRHFRRDD